jgi:hypothetical protein
MRRGASEGEIKGGAGFFTREVYVEEERMCEREKKNVTLIHYLNKTND